MVLALKIFIYLSWIALFVIEVGKTKGSTETKGFMDSLNVWEKAIIFFTVISLVIYGFYLIFLFVFDIGKIRGILNIALLMFWVYATLSKKTN